MTVLPACVKPGAPLLRCSNGFPDSLRRNLIARVRRLCETVTADRSAGGEMNWSLHTV
jgi:hypothetical protein